MDLGFLRLVTAIGLQGAISKETERGYYVKSYKLDLSSNGEDWVPLRENSKPKVNTPHPPWLSHWPLKCLQAKTLWVQTLGS